MDELKPCPFCKAEPLSENNRRFFLKHKLDCFLAHPMHNANCDLVSTGSIADHIEAWNTRPAEDALKAENEKLKSDLEIQKNLTKQMCFENNRAYQETEKWKKMFYDLIKKQSSISTDPKVIVVGTDTNVPTKESEMKHDDRI